MKRHFLTGLKAFAVSVMALLAVSCYDDSRIWNEVENLKKELAELQEKLNDEVQTLNTVIGNLEAKVAVVKVEQNAAGNYVLTFADGKTLEISAVDANANNTGLVTTVKEGNVNYWAVVAADGTVTKLDAVVHPDTKLSFKVDPETQVLYVSYDNGSNWESTGVTVNDETTFNVVEKFVDAEDHVVITVGGVDYELPKVSANYFEIVSGMQYFQPAQTKTMPVNMEGVISSMIAGAPAGWSVKLADGVLKVTAPAGEYEPGYYGGFYPVNEGDEAEGEVVVWVVTEDGQTKVGTVNVAIAGTPAVFAFDKAYEKVTVTFSNEYNGDAGVYFGACKAEDYDPEDVAERVAASAWELAEGVFSNYDNDSGNYASTAEYTFAELLGAAPEAGVKYVVWSVAPTVVSMGEMAVDTGDIVLDYVSVIKVVSADPVVTFKDATIDVSVLGAEEFYVGYAIGYAEDLFGYYLAPDMIAYYEEMGMTLKDVLVNGISSGWGPAQMITNGKVCKGNYAGTLSELTEDEDYYAPGYTLTVVVLPLPAGKTEYTVDDITYFEVTLPELSIGGDATVTFGDATDIKFNSFNLPAESTGAATYYMVMPKEDYAGAAETLAESFLEYIDMFTSKDSKSFSLNVSTDYYGCALSPETEYVVIAFAVSADGKCSELVTKEVKTTPFAYSTTASVTSVAVKVVDGASEDYPWASATIAVEGDAVAVYYYMTNVLNWRGEPNFPDATEDPEGYAAYLKRVVYAVANPDETAIFPHRVTLTADNFKDGKVVITGGTPDDYGNYPLEVGNDNDRVIFAFVEDAAGNLSEAVASPTFNRVDDRE